MCPGREHEFARLDDDGGTVITCAHCGSTLPDGAIICGECGRSVTGAHGRRTVLQHAEERPAPPPLQAPDPRAGMSNGDVWIPESTLDPATRAWLTASQRASDPATLRGPGSAENGSLRAFPQNTARVAQQPEAAQLPRQDQTADHEGDAGRDEFGPRGAPSHVHGAGSGLDDLGGARAQDAETSAQAELGSHADAGVQGEFDAPSQPAGERRGDSASDPGAEPERHRSDASERRDLGDDEQPEVAAAPSVPQFARPPAAPAWWVGRTRRGDGETTTAESLSEDREAPQPGDTAVVQPLPKAPAFAEPPVAQRPALIEPGGGRMTCHVCGHQLEPDDIFCEECGAVRPAVTAAFTGPVVALPTERPDWAMHDDGVIFERSPEPAAEPAAEPAPEPAVEPAADGAGADDESGTVDDDSPAAAAETDRGEDASDDDSRGDTANEDVHVDAPDRESGPATELAAPGRDAPPATAGPIAEDDDDPEATRIVRRTSSERAVTLHFSTGERFGVHGHGLLGRFPNPEPGEELDELLTIVDPGRSVSKTHLEFGRDGDDLWVSDRYSGNGTVVRHIDGSIRRCEPGRRYRVERGARVDIGEQFFLVQ